MRARGVRRETVYRLLRVPLSWVREPDDEALQAVARMLREPVEARGGSRQRPEAVRPRTTADLVTLHNAGVITLAEARRYLRLREEDGRTPSRRSVRCG